MSWDSRPEECPKVFDNNSDVCFNCDHKTECLQSAMGEKLDSYIKVTQKAMESAEKWEKDQKDERERQKQQASKLGQYVSGFASSQKRDKKEVLNEFLTDFCEFISILNSCLAAAGIEISVPDQIMLFDMWTRYKDLHSWKEGD